MEKKTSKDWVSVYLFYDKLDFILSNGVYNFIKQFKEKKKLHNYFFIRYYNKGSHIRLRLLVDQISYDYTVEFTKEYFNSFFNKNPSNRIINNPKFIKNNSVLFTKYSPETLRYGGESAIKIAENHFKDSSETVLKLMEGSTWNFNVAQGKALQLHFIFFKSLRIKKEQIKIILSKLNNKNWRTVASSRISNSDLDSFLYKAYKKNKEKIVSHIDILNSIVDSNEFENYPILFMFYRSTMQTSNEISKVKTINSLESIYASYLHMLNNRLGLSNEDEVYLAFILVKTIDLYF